MRRIEWKVRPVPPLAVIRYCKKCGRKTEFFSSGLFRVNAQKQSLDVWLIYKCADCGATWKDEILSRVRPQSIPGELLEGFHKNDRELAERYELDVRRLAGRGMELGSLRYEIEGEEIRPGEEIHLTVTCDTPLPVKVKSILQNKLGLSNKEYLTLARSGRVRGAAGENLEKCRLGRGIELLILEKDEYKEKEKW